MSKHRLLLGATTAVKGIVQPTQLRLLHLGLVDRLEADALALHRRAGREQLRELLPLLGLRVVRDVGRRAEDGHLADCERLGQLQCRGAVELDT